MEWKWRNIKLSMDKGLISCPLCNIIEHLLDHPVNSSEHINCSSISLQITKQYYKILKLGLPWSGINQILFINSPFWGVFEFHRVSKSFTNTYNVLILKSIYLVWVPMLCWCGHSSVFIPMVRVKPGPPNLVPNTFAASTFTLLQNPMGFCF